MTERRSRRSAVTAVDDGTRTVRRDELAGEEPLEIRVGDDETLAVTMRTPGNDFELAAGFLFTSGLISTAPARIRYCVEGEQEYNVVTVDAQMHPQAVATPRPFLINSSCGVCGSAVIDSLDYEVFDGAFEVKAETLYGLPGALRERQKVFGRTGGLHAAALFDNDGHLIEIREDVGRHNALDKLVGWALLERRLPLESSILMVSGRTSYEIMQKAVAAGIPIVCAVSAPSSLAVDVAQRFNMTLVGFLRDRRFNIYSGDHRILV